VAEKQSNIMGSAMMGIAMFFYKNRTLHSLSDKMQPLNQSAARLVR
jgi:hypothetical protein